MHEDDRIEAFLTELWQENQRVALALLPILAFAEACVGIGLFISGAFLLIVASAVYSTDIAGLNIIIPMAMMGALVGDHAGYYLGRHFGPLFHSTRFAQKYQASIVKAEQMVLRYGGFAIFIGRFIPAIRSLLPALIGISGLPRKLFSLLDFLACLFWALALGLILRFIDFSL